MSLQGNLKDFSITNILPIIKTENKTGTLEVQHENKTVRISFVAGQVVYAHAGEEQMVGRIKDTLLAGGMISPDGWRHLEPHAGEPTALWTALAKAVPPETASRLLRRQVTDTLFDLLRFKKGNYSFSPAKTVEYPTALINPMDVDFLLMEGCRIADEFTQLEQKMPRQTALLRKAITSAEEPSDKAKDAGPHNFMDTFEFVVLQERGIGINEHENKVLSVMATPRSLRGIMNSVDLSNFDASAAILSLLDKKVIAPMSSREIVALQKPEADRLRPGYILFGLIVLITAGAAYIRITYMHPAQMGAWKSLSREINSPRARYEMDGLLSLAETYRLQTGKEAQTPADLVRSGLTSQRDVTDPWGTPYQFSRKDGELAVVSLGEDRQPSADDISAAVPVTSESTPQTAPEPIPATPAP